MNDDNDNKLRSLKKRYDELKRKKVQADVLYEKANDELDNLKSEAMEQFKTDDPNELKKLLAKKKSQNDEMLKKYEEYCSEIETNLATLEKTES